MQHYEVVNVHAGAAMMVVAGRCRACSDRSGALKVMGWST